MALIVIISGLPASGKTTVAKAVASNFGLACASGGDVLKGLAARKGYEISSDDWWDTKPGLEFLQERRASPDYDREVDRILMERAKGGEIVITSYTLPWLMKEGIKIWLGAGVRARAERMACRDKIGVDDAMAVVEERDRENTELYKKLYGIRLGEDLSVFDLVVNTDGLKAEVVIEIVSVALKHFAARAQIKA